MRYNQIVGSNRYIGKLSAPNLNKSSNSTPRVYSESGVDLTLLRWMISKTPSERLNILQNNVSSLIKLRHARRSA